MRGDDKRIVRMRYHPFGRMYSMFDEMEAMFDNLIRLPGENWGLMKDYRRAWGDIDYRQNGLTAKIEMPGISAENIDITLRESGLEIIAKKEEVKEEGEKGKAGYRFERNYRGFQRFIPLAKEPDMDKIVATYEKGVLNLEVPYKRTEEQPEEPKKIKVTPK
jgi:HSP20 family molecular chaperone IbpA